MLLTNESTAELTRSYGADSNWLKVASCLTNREYRVNAVEINTVFWEKFGQN